MAEFRFASGGLLRSRSIRNPQSAIRNPLSGSRVVSLKDFSKPFVGYVSVDLSSADVAVAKHHLDGSQVGAIFKEMRRKAVPQQVRRDMTYARFIAVGHYKLPESLPRDVFPSRADEQSRGVLAIEQRDANSDVSPDPRNRALPQRDRTFLCPFSKCDQKAEIQVEVCHLQ